MAKGVKVQLPSGFKFTPKPPVFAGHFREFGGSLPSEPEVHALWYYMLLATQAWKEETEQVVYEGDPDYIAPFRELFQRCAEMYGADINTMANRWPLIIAEINRVNLVRFTNGDPLIKVIPERLRNPHGRAV